MEYLDKLCSWLESCPLLAGKVYVDHTDGQPGCWGLYPTGLKELSRRRDVMGNTFLRLQCSYQLRWVAAALEGAGDNARLVLMLQQWIKQQSLLGQAPVFGDEPAEEKILAHSGKLTAADPNGTVLYSLQLQVEFTKNMIAKE